MELTQLNPKIERHLIEVQKILDRDPAVRRKLWGKLILSTLGLLAMLGLYLWFEYLFKNNHDNYFFVLLTLLLGLTLGLNVGIFIFLQVSFFAGFKVSYNKTKAAILKISNKCNNKSPELLKIALSAKEIKCISNMQKTAWIEIGNLFFTLGLFVCLIWILIMWNGFVNSFQMDYNLFQQQYFVFIKLATVSCGILYGLVGMLLIDCFVYSFMALAFHLQDSPDQLLLKLRKLEREICEKENA